jgi:hypothetical protein
MRVERREDKFWGLHSFTGKILYYPPPRSPLKPTVQNKKKLQRKLQIRSSAFCRVLRACLYNKHTKTKARKKKPECTIFFNDLRYYWMPNEYYKSSFSLHTWRYRYSLFALP